MTLVGSPTFLAVYFVHPIVSVLSMCKIKLDYVMCFLSLLRDEAAKPVIEVVMYFWDQRCGTLSLIYFPAHNHEVTWIFFNVK